MQRVLQWLLEEEQPAARYLTLIDLLDRPKTDPEVRETLDAIPERGWAKEILRSQKPEGYWESSKSLYRPKYIATNWRLIVLSDLGLTARDPRVRKPCELFLDQYAMEDGGFGARAVTSASLGTQLGPSSSVDTRMIAASEGHSIGS